MTKHSTTLARPSADGTPAAETRMTQVYQQLRADILNGKLPPGSPLQFARLKDGYGASMGVLREALTRLAAEGLAEAQAQHGFRVVSLSVDDLNDLTDTRATVEGLLFRDSIENGDLEWETRVLSSHHRLERTAKFAPEAPETVTEAWSLAHQQFHAALLSGARSRRLQAIAANLRAAAEVYRRWSMAFETTARAVTEEHKELADLALARDKEAAVDALARHFDLTRRLILTAAPDGSD